MKIMQMAIYCHTMKKATVLASICISLASHATAEVTEGVLEKGPTYSALFSASPESGDLIGYAFKNQSPVGRNILQNCLPGMLCTIAKSTTRPMQNASALKFADQPAGWMEITMARNVSISPVVFGYEKTLKTRHGMASIREEDNTLLFRGKPTKPAVEGNSGLSIIANYEVGNTDVLLLQSTGGTACPALYRFVSIGPSSLDVSPEFGTCSDIIYPTFNARTGVTMAMLGFVGPFEPAAAQKRAAMTKTIYQWSPRGQLTVNGKPVR